MSIFKKIFIFLGTILLSSCLNSSIKLNLLKPNRIFTIHETKTVLAKEDSSYILSPNIEAYYINKSISFSCFYDQLKDSTVVETNACSDLDGADFNSVNGELKWIPLSTSIGEYEFKIKAIALSEMSESIHAINVEYRNHAPVIQQVFDVNYTGVGNNSLSYNFNLSTGTDRDVDDHSVTYSLECTIEESDCSDFIKEQYTFNTSTGALTWELPIFESLDSITLTVTADDLQCSEAPYSRCRDEMSYKIYLTNYKQSFVSTWRLTAGDFNLFINTALDYDFVISWGDGSPREVFKKGVTDISPHEFENEVESDFKIVINGKVEGISSVDPDSELTLPEISKLMSVENLGDLGWKSFNHAFYEASELSSVSGGVTDDVTDMGMMFNSCENLSELNIGHWDVSKVVNTNDMFWGITAESLDLSSWDLESVVNVNSMFGGISTELNVVNWELPLVTDTSWMFVAYEGDELDLSGWKLPLLENAQFMFAQVTSNSINLANWETPMLQNIVGMFLGTDQYLNLDMRGWFTNFNSLLATVYDEEVEVGNVNQTTTDKILSGVTYKVPDENYVYFYEDELDDYSVSVNIQCEFDEIFGVPCIAE